MTTSSDHTHAKPQPATIMTVGESLVPVQTYQLPQFMLNSYSPDIGWRSESTKAVRHAIGLMMQAYALAWMELFEEHPALKSVTVKMGDDGSIDLQAADGEEVDALGHGFQRINSLCDYLIAPFIKDLLVNLELRRDGLEEAISQSYDFIARGMGLAGWDDAQAKRQSALEACLLEEATAPAASGSRGPRL